eukprot:gnl/TRDRNA2_/TRDRNA2_174920_c2_seq1.p1 gnl/TRDRNA2_/TRDRNA2_174920_c2~~gnl/TRDRNA2_/TRDRNA2_174920_c2_seq1.p1  ORF type:complete len:591 (-),score=123.02 gnl/TRDRNA2_/TRDRNA2_174920_c2_seq1:185-1930(-)
MFGGMTSHIVWGSIEHSRDDNSAFSDSTSECTSGSGRADNRDNQFIRYQQSDTSDSNRGSFNRYDQEEDYDSGSGRGSYQMNNGQAQQGFAQEWQQQMQQHQMPQQHMPSSQMQQPRPPQMPMQQQQQQQIEQAQQPQQEQPQQPALPLEKQPLLSQPPEPPFEQFQPPQQAEQLPPAAAQTPPLQQQLPSQRPVVPKQQLPDAVPPLQQLDATPAKVSEAPTGVTNRAAPAPRPVVSQRPSDAAKSRPQPQQEVVLHLTIRAWGEVLLLGLTAMAILWLADRGKRLEFSLPYAICYNVICIRVPDLLGHTVISSLGSAHLYTSPAVATMAISCGYMGAMQIFLILLRWICRSMSTRNLFPRFLFLAQMYYYIFWYMMLMVVSPHGIEDPSFWVMVAMLNGNYLVSNVGVLQYISSLLRCRTQLPDPPLKIIYDSKLAVQDQLADVMSLLIVPAVATAFHVCASLKFANTPAKTLISLWQRFGVLLIARLVSGLLTEEIFRRRVDMLYKADTMELQLVPHDASNNRQRYLNDLCVGKKLALESMRNIERCEFLFAAVAVSCTFSVFQRGDVPARYAFVAFG